MKKYPPFLEVVPACQNYLWGKEGSHSAVWPFIQDDSKDDAKPYAEAWFGTHKSGMSRVLTEAGPVPLAEYLGKSISPLVKVLSIAEPLSIQLHPSAADARPLHESDPISFPDPLAKTEAGIALSPVEMLCGLISDEDFLKLLPFLPMPFENFSIGERPTKNIAYTCLLRTLKLPESELKIVLEKLAKSIGAKDVKMLSKRDSWVLEMLHRYPNGDRGILSFYFLNFIELSPGQSMFIPVGVPHAYLSGDLVEIMVPSDNVIRGGLTPKAVNLKLLSRCLDASANSVIVEPSNHHGVSSYSYPENLFQLSRVGHNQGLEFDAKTQKLLLFVNAKSKFNWALHDDSDEGSLEISGCKALLIPKGSASYCVAVSEGEIFVITYPRS